MTADRYIIREVNLGYDDEVYFNAGHTLYDVYTDKGRALADLRKLQLQRIKQVPLAETASLFNGSELLLKKVDLFIKDKTGESVLKGGEHLDLGTDMPAGMSDDALLELGNMIDTAGYELVKLSDTHMLYLLWNPNEDEPHSIYDESGEYLIYSHSEDALLNDAEETLNYALDDYFEGEGSYDQLSNSPELLKSLVDTHEQLQYDDKNPAIEIVDELDASLLRSLNALLKTPFYTVRELSTQDIMKLEKDKSH